MMQTTWMGTMLRSNGQEGGFEIVEKNTDLSDTCNRENEIIRASEKGHWRRKKFLHHNLVWIDCMVFVQVAGCPMSLAVYMYLWFYVVAFFKLYNM